MYTSIRHYNVMPDSVNEVIRRAVEGFVPVISRARGFLGYDLVNTGNDTITTITTFDSEITALHSNTLAKSWDDENLSSLITGPPTVMSGKVSVHKNYVK